MVETAKSKLQQSKNCIFILILLIFASFAFTLLLLLNILFIVTIVFLPSPTPLPSASDSYESWTNECEDSCAQFLRYYNKWLDSVGEIRAMWHLLASHVIFFYFLPITFADMFITFSMLFYARSRSYKNQRNANVNKQQRQRQSLPNKENSFVSLEDQISHMFNTIRFVVIGSFNGCYIYAATLENSSPCLRLIDVAQLISLFTISFRRGYDRRFALAMTMNSNKIRCREFKVIVYAITVFFEDFWNCAAIITFLTALILKLGNNRFAFSGSLNIPFLNTLFAQTECVPCSMFAPCPIERVVYAEHFFIYMLAYFRRTYKHWSGAQNQRQQRQTFAIIAQPEPEKVTKKSNHRHVNHRQVKPQTTRRDRIAQGEVKNRAKGHADAVNVNSAMASELDVDELIDYEEYDDLFFATFVLRPLYERVVPALHRQFDSLGIRMNSDIPRRSR